MISCSWCKSSAIYGIDGKLNGESRSFYSCLKHESLIRTLENPVNYTICGECGKCPNCR